MWQKAEYIRHAGNVAVHGNKTPAPEQALNVVRELAHVLYWAGRTFLRKGAESLHGKTFDESLVPTQEPGAAPASVEELDALKRDLDAAEDARKEVEGELEVLRERLAAIKAENQTVPETRDWNESTTRRLIIDLALQRAGWPLDQKHDREYEVTGMPNASGVGSTPITSCGEMTASRSRWWRRRRPPSIRRRADSRPNSTRTAWRPCTASVRSSSTRTATRPACGMTRPTSPWKKSVR